MSNKLDIINLQCTRQQKKIFTNLSFSVKAQELLIIEGPNGSGKSSLLRLLSGLMSPTAGEIRFNQTAIAAMRFEYWQYLHYLGHTNGLKLGLTVIENFNFTEKLTGLKLETERTTIILEQLQLTETMHLPITQLSAGQKRKVALARLKLFPKLIWILDEPLTGLDKTMQALFITWLKKHLQDNGLCILSSHHHLSLPNAQFLRLDAC